MGKQWCLLLLALAMVLLTGTASHALMEYYTFRGLAHSTDTRMGFQEGEELYVVIGVDFDQPGQDANGNEYGFFTQNVYSNKIINGTVQRWMQHGYNGQNGVLNTLAEGSLYTVAFSGPSPDTSPYSYGMRIFDYDYEASVAYVQNWEVNKVVDARYTIYEEGDYLSYATTLMLTSKSLTLQDLPPDFSNLPELPDLPSPTPIPGAVWLLGTGLVGLLGLRKKFA